MRLLRRKIKANRSERVSYRELAQRAQVTSKPLPMRLRVSNDTPGPDTGNSGPPQFMSWDDFLARTPISDIRRWCGSKATVANREKFMSGKPAERVSTQNVADILMAAKGRCRYCGSLCVEKMPRGSWSSVGRRIGSLGHDVARVNGGTNSLVNLSWCCLWCNVWPSERTSGATDHGAVREL